MNRDPMSKTSVGQLQTLSNSHFEMDVRRVLDMQRMKGYLTVGEAFEAVFYDEFVIFAGEVVPRWTLTDEALSQLDEVQE